MEALEAPSVFISYSHKDEQWKDLLRSHLGVLEQKGRIVVWDDRQIDGGDKWYPEIVAAMERAAVAICLVSSDFLKSDFINKEEIPHLIERRQKEDTVLLPVLVRPCLWEIVDWISSVNSLPIHPPPHLRPTPAARAGGMYCSTCQAALHQP
jgi:hypothetical protein